MNSFLGIVAENATTSQDHENFFERNKGLKGALRSGGAAVKTDRRSAHGAQLAPAETIGVHSDAGAGRWADDGF